MGSDIHIYLFNVTIEGWPDFYFVAGWGEKAQSLLDVSATDDSVLICC